MEFTEIYSEEDEEFFQPTTNKASYQEGIINTKYKKLLNSKIDINNFSSIFRLELENSNRKKSDNSTNNEKQENNNEYENEPEISEKEIKEINDDDKKIIHEETFEDTNNTKKNHTFIWSEGGNDVKVTGSFSDWKKKFQMTREPNEQIFKYDLPLGNEIYQYKFIVDGEWKFSKYFPTKDDGNGNINNILDNTKNTSFQQPKNKKTNDKKTKSTKIKNKKVKNKQSRISTKTKTAKTRASTVNKEIITRKNSIYQSVYPSYDDIPLPLPNKRYYASFKLEDFTNQKAIGNKQYYDYYDRYCFSYEASSRPIFILGHINLNHLISVKNNRSNMLKNSMSFRYREKASTFIYYKYNKKSLEYLNF